MTKKTGWLVSLAVLLCGASWALASPVGSASDDNFHLASIWCSHGIRDGYCEKADEAGFRKVPAPIASAGTCFLGDSEKSGSCAAIELAQFSEVMISTDRVASNGLFRGQQSIFYWINGLLVGENIEQSVLLMRFLNFVILLILFSLASRAQSPAVNARLRLIVLSVSLPTFAWTVSSTNSSSWAFLGTTFSWFFMDTTLKGSTRDNVVFARFGLLLSLTLAVGSRSETIPFLVLQCVTVLALRPITWWGSQARRTFYVCIGLILASLLALFLSNAWKSFFTAFDYVNDDSPLIRSGQWVLIYNLQAVPVLYYWIISSIGVLRSNDFELFQTVGILMTVVIAVIVSTGLKASSKQAQLVVAFLALVALTIPVVLLQGNKLLIGEELVSRYVFPIFVLFIGTTIWHDSSRFQLSRGVSFFIASLLSVVHLIVLRQVILRFTVGIEQYGLLNLSDHSEWWWNVKLLPSPLATWLLGSVTFTFLTFWVLRSLNTTEITTPSTQTKLS